MEITWSDRYRVSECMYVLLKIASCFASTILAPVLYSRHVYSMLVSSVTGTKMDLLSYGSVTMVRHLQTIMFDTIFCTLQRVSSPL